MRCRPQKDDDSDSSGSSARLKTAMVSRPPNSAHVALGLTGNTGGKNLLYEQCMGGGRERRGEVGTKNRGRGPISQRGALENSEDP